MEQEKKEIESEIITEADKTNTATIEKEEKKPCLLYTSPSPRDNR